MQFHLNNGQAKAVKTGQRLGEDRAVRPKSLPEHTGDPRVTQELPKSYPRATQGLPKGYPRDAQGTNTGATPEQHRISSRSPAGCTMHDAHAALVQVAITMPSAALTEDDAERP
jgi:hypothetical protein